MDVPIFNIQRRRSSWPAPRTITPIIILTAIIQPRRAQRRVKTLHRPCLLLTLHTEHLRLLLGSLHVHSRRHGR